MKRIFSSARLPSRALFIACSSHERRCLGLLSQLNEWRPDAAVLFHYDDHNPRREEHHNLMEADLRKSGINPTVLTFTEASAVKSLNDNMAQLHEVLRHVAPESIVLDMTVFTKRHLLMILAWLDDIGYWDTLSR